MFEPGGEVHLWSAAVSELEHPAHYDAAWALLPASEQQHAGRFRFESDRKAFLALRALRRRVLSRYADVDPGRWEFTANEHGRPRIAYPALDETLDFNCSKCADVVICAVTRGVPVGVDIECTDRKMPEDLAESAFAPSEKAALAALPQHQKRKRFFAYWTLKESYLKARGVGLSVPLDSMAFSVSESPRPEGQLAFSTANDCDRWHFTLLAPTPSHMAAVCVRSQSRAGPQVVMRRFPPGRLSLC